MIPPTKIRSTSNQSKHFHRGRMAADFEGANRFDRQGCGNAVEDAADMRPSVLSWT
jgi:hypothetical protein